MNENTKTLSFLAAAAVLLALGIWTGIPAPETDEAREQIGKEFFADFTDPLKVGSAQIVDLDPTTDVKHELQVKKVDGVWEINPGKQGYAQVSPERLADVVKALIGIKMLGVVTDNPELHREFEVVDPTNEAELKAGTDGVGKRVTLKDENDKTLVDLIVGKVDDKSGKGGVSEVKQKPIVYARRPGQSRIYTTELATDRLSSNFGDWALGDLLQVGAADLQAVKIDDYGIDLRAVDQRIGGQRGVVMRALQKDIVQKAKADFKKEAGKWTVGRLEVFDEKTKSFVERKAAADESIETAKLDQLKTALSNLKIVDAVRKPKALAADLQLEKTFLTNPESPVWNDEEVAYLLTDTGFPLSQKSEKEFDFISHDGEMTVGFTNGIRYHLRFGDITGKGRAGQGAEGKDGKPAAKTAEAKAAEGAAEGSTTAPNRYLMVSASFDETLIPKPKLTPLGGEEKKTEADKPQGENKPSEAAKPEAKPKTEEAPKTPAAATPAKPAEPKKTEPTKTEPSKTDTKTDKQGDSGACADEEEEAVDQLAQAEAPKADAPKNDAPKTDAPKASSETPAASKPADAKPADTKPADAKPADAKPAETKPGDAKPAAGAAPAAEPKVVEPALTPEERKRIEAENKQNQEKYEADVKAGREKAQELKAQFAEWFYVVSDATFRDLHLEPTSLIAKKAPPAEGAPPGGGLPGGGLPPGLPNLIPQLPK